MEESAYEKNNQYYKFYNKHRLEFIASKKIFLVNRQIRNRYYIYFTLVLLFLAILPIISWESDNFNGYFVKLCSEQKWALSFVGLWSLTASFAGYEIYSGLLRIEDTNKKVKVFNKNIFFLIVLLLAVLLVDYLILILSKIDIMGQDIMFIRSSSYSLLIIWSMSYYHPIIKSIKSNVSHLNPDEYLEDKIFIYWVYFVRSLWISNPYYLISMFLVIILSVLQIVGQFDVKGIIGLAGFYSFLFASINFTINPILTGIGNLNNTYHRYSMQILSNSIYPNLNNHVLIIGGGNLGNAIIKNCLLDIHPEGYGIESLSEDGDDLCDKSIDMVKDFDIIIDANLRIKLISRRIVVVDKDVTLFSTLFDNVGNQPFAIFHPWGKKIEKISILGICGDAINDYVLDEVRIKYSSVIINATRLSDLSLKLAADYPNKRQILSANNSSVYETLTSNTYDKKIFLIDTQSIEGIALSKLIFQACYNNITTNLSRLYEECEYNFREEIESRIYSKLDYCDIKYKLLSSGNGRILLIGSTSYIYNIIQGLWYTMKFHTKFNNGWIKEILENKLYILTDDQSILDGTIIQNSKRIMKLYPVRDDTTKIEDCLNITTFKGDITNFESIINVLDFKISKTKTLKPDIIVLLNEKKFVSVDMFSTVQNAVQVIKKTYFEKETKSFKNYNPHIFVYSHTIDKFYLEESFNKYISFNCERKQRKGFPSQLIKESKYTKDNLSAHQFSSMMKALYSEFEERESDHSQHTAEIILTIGENPTSLAHAVAGIVGKRLIYNFQDETEKLPSFLYYNSIEEKFYKDTFVFRGLAEITEFNKNWTFKDAVKYCFINSHEEQRKLIANVLRYNLELNSGFEDFEEPPKYDLGMFSHYPISTILRHRNIRYDVLQRRPRFFYNSINSSKTANGNENNSTPLRRFGNCNNSDLKDKLLMQFNIAQFSVWSEGENYPGSLASMHSKLIFSDLIDLENYSLNNSESEFVPSVFYSTNKPSFNINKEYFSQDSFYVKLVPKTLDYQNQSDELIRAIKIDLPMDIINKHLDWSNYLTCLKSYLLNKNIKYSLFIIEKYFTEGSNLETDEGIIELNKYKKSLDDNFTEFETSFWIIKKTNKEQNTMKNMPHLYEDYFLPSDLIENNYQNSIERFQYEMVLIRSDIVEKSLNELHEGHMYGKFQNMLYFIDEL